MYIFIGESGEMRGMRSGYERLLPVAIGLLALSCEGVVKNARQSSLGGGLSNTSYLACKTISSDPTALGSCLSKSGVASAATAQSQISACQTAGNTSDLDLAICLSKNGLVVADHRPPTQFDFDRCSTAPP